MEIIEGNYGKCYICDNMDKNVGLPSLKPKSWDLCLTDPPYNCNVKRADKINYIDTFDNYPEYCKLWFEMCRCKSNSMLFTPGIPNEWLYPVPDWELCWFHAGSTTLGKRGMFSHWQPILYYSTKVIRNTDSISLPDIAKHYECDHPTLKPIALWKWLINNYNASSVIDPFLGSGTTAEACEELGIPWLGYEIKAEYIPTIEKRIQNGIHLRSNQFKIQELGEY